MKAERLSSILRYISEGGIIIYPTDTLYALGADIYNEEAVRRIFEIKQRPLNNPLPVAVSSKEDIEEIASVNHLAEMLIDEFLPGPLTIILKKRKVPDTVTAGLANVALRIPNNRKALQLLSKAGPLTVTSANIHGMDVPACVGEIEEQLGIKLMTIDDGALRGKPSTIVDVTHDRAIIVRHGAISEKRIRDVIGNG